MSSSPLPKKVTRPVDETFASALLEDCHVDTFVTSRTLPSDIRADADSWTDEEVRAPLVTVTPATVAVVGDAGLDELPQAAVLSAVSAIRKPTNLVPKWLVVLMTGWTAGGMPVEVFQGFAEISLRWL